MRSMVEGYQRIEADAAFAMHSEMLIPHHHAASPRGPPPPPGEDFFSGQSWRH
jgi:hypothetical protein